MTTKRGKRLLRSMGSSEASKCWRESARDCGVSRCRVGGIRGAQGRTVVPPLVSSGSGVSGCLPLCGSVDSSIFRRPNFRFPEGRNVFQRSEAMKPINLSWSQFVFVTALTLVVAAAFPPSAVRAATEAARVVKYSKEDIVPVRAKLRFSTLIVLPEDEEILDFTTGDKEFWIINGAHNLCYVHPAQAGIRSNLNLITASGHVYSFLLTEISNQPNVEPDLKIFVEPKEGSGISTNTGLRGYVSAGEAEAYKKELETLRSQTADQIHAAQAQSAEQVGRFRSSYATKLQFDYSLDPKAPREPFLVSVIYHDDSFTYIKCGAREKPALYEIKDGKPNLISFQFENDVYIAPKIIDTGYLAIGKKKMPFARRFFLHLGRLAHHLSSVRRNATRKRHFLFADGEVAGVDDFGCDVNAVLELERDQVGLAVLDFVESGFFPRAALDIGERVVVVDDGNQERFPRRLRVEGVIELEFGCVAGAETSHLLGGLGLRRVDLIRRLGAERFEFLLVGFRFPSAHISAQPGVRRDAGAFLGLNEDYEIGFDIRLIADFRQQKGIDVAAGGNQVQVAANAGLGGMNVAEVVRAVDDPEFLVAGGEIEDLFVLG